MYSLSEKMGRRELHAQMTIDKCSYPMIPFEKAKEIVDLLPIKTTTEIISARDGINRVIAEPIFAQFNFPPFRASIMDGFAIADLTAKTFIINGKSLTGHGTDIHLSGNNAIYITTGAPVPSGATAVVMIENCDVNEDKTEFKLTNDVQKLTDGLNIRGIGSDFSKGTTLVEMGSKLTAADIGLVAMAGIFKLNVFSRPKVSILSTGHELCDFDKPLEPGQIYDANLPMLRALIEECGGQVIEETICRDDAKMLKNFYSKCQKENIDLVVSTGALSMGSTDVIKHTLMQIADVKFGRVNLKPGKPMTAAVIPPLDMNTSASLNTLALPGNPVSAWVCATLFVAPLVRRMSGVRNGNDLPPLVNCVAVQNFKPDVSRPEFHRAIIWTLGGKLHAASTGSQLSSRLLSIRSANGIILIPPATSDEQGILAGSDIQAFLLAPPLNAPPNEVASSLLISPHACPCGGHHNEGEASRTTPPLKPNHPSMAHAPLSSIGIRGESNISCSVIVVSDTCYKDSSQDRSGSAAVNWLLTNLPNSKMSCLSSGDLKHGEVLVTGSSHGDGVVVVPDDEYSISSVVNSISEAQCNILVVSGGTGLSPRDVTIQSVSKLFKKALPGLSHAMIAYGLSKTPLACLANCSAGITKDNCLVLCVPGSPKAVTESLDAIKTALPHAIRIMHQI